MNKNCLSLKTPSKINIFLRITGKLPNGYHELENIFLPLEDIYDIISIKFKANNGIKITSSNSNIPLTKDNLCFKAADLFSSEAGIKPEFEINIEKNIPVAAGMGGGSSDAAAVLLILQKYYSNILPIHTLNKLALELGADVPFFLNPTPSLGKGVGEKLEKITVAPGLYVIIATPHFPVSAAWAYKNHIPSSRKIYLVDVLNYLKSANWPELGKSLYNDLATALYSKFPAEGIIKSKLIEAGAINAEITGSGPTLFGITDSPEKAIKIVKEVNVEYPGTINCKYSKVLIK